MSEKINGSTGMPVMSLVVGIGVALVTMLAGPDRARAQTPDAVHARAVSAVGSVGLAASDGSARVPSLLAYMEEKGNNIVVALRTMPAEKYDFIAAEGQRTFRQQAVHVAEMNYAVCSALTGAALPNPGMRHDSPKQELVAGIDRSFDYCGEVLSDAGDSALSGTFRAPDGKTIPKAKMVYFLAGNWADHYGHFATHLRMNGLPTPNIWALPATILRATTRR